MKDNDRFFVLLTQAKAFFTKQIHSVRVEDKL